MSGSEALKQQQLLQLIQAGAGNMATVAGYTGDEVSVSVRTQPTLLPSCEQPSFSVSGNTKLWGNVNVLARCANEKRFLQVTVQATGNYVVAAQPVARGSVLQPDNVALKRGRLDQLPPRTMLDINQAQDSVSLRDLAPGQPIQLSMLRQAWRIKAGQRVWLWPSTSVVKSVRVKC